MPSLRIEIDLVVYGSDGRLLLLAEAKSRRGTSASWAASLRRNMLSHGLLPDSEYFLVATPEHLYMWRQQFSGPDALPEITIDAKRVLQPYFERLRQDPERIGPETFDFLIQTWLGDLTRYGDEAVPETIRKELAATPWFFDFIHSLRNAQIEMNPKE